MVHRVEEAKQCPVLTQIRRTAYSKLKTLVILNPIPSADLNLNTIVEKLAKHYHSDTVKIAERFKFFKCQQGNEGVTDCMAELCKLAKHATLAITWTQHYMINSCGLKEPQIQCELLCVQKLTMAQVLE